MIPSKADLEDSGQRGRKPTPIEVLVDCGPEIAPSTKLNNAKGRDSWRLVFFRSKKIINLLYNSSNFWECPTIVEEKIGQRLTVSAKLGAKKGPFWA
jgi:hypothetical protein